MQHMTFDDIHIFVCTLLLSWRRKKDTSKMLLTVSSFGESHRRLSTGGGTFNGQSKLHPNEAHYALFVIIFG